MQSWIKMMDLSSISVNQNLGEDGWPFDSVKKNSGDEPKADEVCASTKGSVHYFTIFTPME